MIPDNLTTPHSLLDVNPEMLVSGSVIIINSETDIPQYIDYPLRPVISALYERNIKTYMSSANVGSNPDGNASFSIYIDSLSDDNARIVEQLVSDKKASYYNDIGGSYLQIACGVDPTDAYWVDKISQKALEAAGDFKKQAFLWCPRETLSSMQVMFGYSSPEEASEVTEKDWEAAGYFYDVRTGSYFLSREHIKKFHESMDEFGHDKDGSPV